MKQNFFQFKQFKVHHDQSSMKVGTDAVLLACLAEMGDSKQILDIGCGSGIISLICGQNSNAQILGIDIDNDSIEQAKNNFKWSPWAQKLKASCISLQDFSSSSTKLFDLIISNPPFFVDSMKSGIKKRNLARHNDHLSFQDLIISSKSLLNSHGKIIIILPFTEGLELIQIATENDLYLSKQISIFPKKSKEANRLVIEFGLTKSTTSKLELIIREENNEYTKEYKELTKDFYLAF